MNKKGFTLIELLAVIVILAIIALIATPIVLNIIADAKGESELRSAGFYLDAVELSIAQSTLEGQNIIDNTYYILSNGNVCLKYESDNTTCEEELKVEVKGETPKEGTITISNGKIDGFLLTLNNKKITKDSKNELIYVKTLRDVAVKSEFTDNALASCLTDRKVCEPGTKFTIQVNNTETQNFYVISDANNMVTLIMDRNLGASVDWNDSYDNKNGPINALKYLEDKTDLWENITSKIYVVQDENEPKVYDDITITDAHARLLKKEEAEELGCVEGWHEDGLCPDWLTDNLDGSSSNKYAYWTSSAHSYGNTGAYVVFYDKNFDHASAMFGLQGYDQCGIRPVIEILK